MMNKSFKKYLAIWAILFAVFQVLCFVTPSEIAGYKKFGGAFWAGYILITLAFIGRLVSVYFVLKKKNGDSEFYRFPVLRASFVGFIAAIIVGVLCMAIPDLPNWIAIVAGVLVIAITAITIIKSQVAGGIAEDIGTKVKGKTVFTKILTAEAEQLMDSVKSPEMKEICRKVYESVRYSDPMSSDGLSGIESEITLRFDKFEKAVKEEKTECAEIADQVIALLNDRNARCKVLK